MAKPYTEEQIKQITEPFFAGKSLQEISKLTGRSVWTVVHTLVKARLYSPPEHAVKAWDAKQDARAIELHLSGLPTRDIAERLHRSENAVDKRLRRLGYTASTTGNYVSTRGIKETEIERIQRLYEDGVHHTRIASQEAMSPRAVRTLARKHGWKRPELGRSNFGPILDTTPDWPLTQYPGRLSAMRDWIEADKRITPIIEEMHDGA